MLGQGPSRWSRWQGAGGLSTVVKTRRKLYAECSPRSRGGFTAAKCRFRRGGGGRGGGRALLRWARLPVDNACPAVRCDSSVRRHPTSAARRSPAAVPLERARASSTLSYSAFRLCARSHCHCLATFIDDSSPYICIITDGRPWPPLRGALLSRGHACRAPLRAGGQVRGEEFPVAATALQAKTRPG